MLDLSKEINQSLDLLDKVYKQSSNKKELVLDKGKTVYLQVALFKIPFTAPRKRKFLKLCHSLYGKCPEICLFVPNRKTGVGYKKTTEELIDFCVDHYTELLEKHKVKGITTVMPLKQLKAEYGGYEPRRKLVHRFDLFLCKNSLLYNSRFLSSLGKIFRVANKEPFGVPFPKEDVDYDPEFQKNIERAIYTSSFYINRFSDNYSIPFGCLSNTKTELKENLEEVLRQICNDNLKIIPGGVKNIRAMYVWPSQSKPIPLYINPEFPADMKTPYEKSKKKKRPRGVEDEISTQPGKKVFVTAGGDVFVTDTKKDLTGPEIFDSEEEDSFRDESDNDDRADNEREGDVKVKKENSKSNEGDGDEDESESEDDDEIEEKEARMLEIKRRTESDPHPKGKRSIQKTNEGDDEDLEVNKNQKLKSSENGKKSKGNKLSKKKEKSGKINKTKRKTLIKQEKLNKKGKSKGKRIGVN